MTSGRKSPAPDGFGVQSHDFPGHENRLASHTERIRGHPCECGSGKRYGECCMIEYETEQGNRSARKRKWAK